MDGTDNSSETMLTAEEARKLYVVPINPIEEELNRIFNLIRLAAPYKNDIAIHIEPTLKLEISSRLTELGYTLYNKDKLHISW